MPKIAYKTIDFEESTLAIVKMADRIATEYQQKGFDLTLRQLYYQFVARGYLPNTQKMYAKLSTIVSDGRLAGLIDWNAIVDRTRNVMSIQHWDSPSSTVATLAHSYHEDLWKTQNNRVEVWIEKDALVGVLQQICPKLDVPFFSCRGYTSQSEMWSAAQRIIKRAQKGQGTIILHLGDHDPSGIDMTRDIRDRLTLFVTHHIPTHTVFAVKRIALTMKQIERYNPPPNPAKVTDSRFKKYQAKYGQHSWELDALDPLVLVNLIDRKVKKYVDMDKMQQALQQQNEAKAQLRAVSKKWHEAVLATS